MRTISFLALCCLACLAPMTGVAWETADGGIFYTMVDLVDSSQGAVTTIDSTKFVIADQITISNRDTLLIDPGDSLCFQKLSPVIVMRINGTLWADGDPGNPIVFTSNESSPDSTTWGRIEFEKNPAGSIFDHCHISYAATALSCDSSNLGTISNANITSVGSGGISLNNSSPVIRNCTITDFTGSGIICTGTSQPVVGGSQGFSNTMYNTIPPTGFTLKNFTANTITATHNDWGIQDYTYIDSIIVDDDENPSYGEVIFQPVYDIIPPESIDDVVISLPDSNISLSWSAITVDTSGEGENLSHYVIYRDTVAHFLPQKSDSIGTADGTSFTDSSGTVGDVSTDSFYRVVAVDDAGNTSAFSNEVGEYDFQLETTTGTDYSWVAFSLGDTSIHMASDLEAHIEAYSSPAADCYTVSEWNATAQTYTIYTTIPIPMGDFALESGHAYRVEVDASVVWTLVGDVLPADSVSFELKTTTGTDYTWVSVPLHLDSLSMASDLEAHIEAYSSPAADCYTISEWNATAQTYTIYTTIPIPMGDFAIRTGRAYRVETDIPASWPAP